MRYVVRCRYTHDIIAAYDTYTDAAWFQRYTNRPVYIERIAEEEMIRARLDL